MSKVMSPTDSDVPEHFQVVHLDLAQEPGDRGGSASDRYTLLLPLGPDGRILEALARTHPDYCRVSRMLPEGGVVRGLMRPGPGRNWRIDFGEAEEAGYRFAEERFRPGDRVTVLRGADPHTYQVVVLQPL
jgi:hypothetical protein